MDYRGIFEDAVDALRQEKQYPLTWCWCQRGPSRNGFWRGARSPAPEFAFAAVALASGQHGNRQRMV